MQEVQPNPYETAEFPPTLIKKNNENITIAKQFPKNAILKKDPSKRKKSSETSSVWTESDSVLKEKNTLDKKSLQ